MTITQQETLVKEENIPESAKIKETTVNTQNLLKDLIKGVEEFLTNKEIRGLSESIRCIFYHGLALDKHGIPNIKRVFGVLDFLNEKSTEGQWNSFNKWLLESVSKGKLTNLLAFLFSDTEHIESCYEPTAFIRNEGFQNALMTCILALETSQPNLLKSIESSLYDPAQTKRLGHRRSSSTPQMIFLPSTLSATRKAILKNTKKMSRTLDCSNEKVKVAKHRKWKSLPNLHHETANVARRPRSKTINLRNQVAKVEKKVSFVSVVETGEMGAVTEDVPYFEYKNSSVTELKGITITKPKVPVHVVKVDDIKIHTDYRYSPDYQKSLKPEVGEKKSPMFSFLDHPAEAKRLSTSAIPTMSTSPTDIFFSTGSVVSGAKIHSTSPIAQSLENPVRKQSSRQNLDHFIQLINHSSRPKVALDRENAHFHLSEAIIATSQQLKWNKIISAKFKIMKDVRVKEDPSFSPKRQILPPSRNKTTFTVGSVDDNDSESSLSNDEAGSDNRTNSTSSDDANANVPQMEWNVSDDPHSAESIAMMLLSRFKNQQATSPNNLLWMVNESQAPQQLLPFPDSFSLPINPDDPFHLNTFIRGSKEWAPPRQQIIFTVHPLPDRRRQILKQSNRCTGCGMKVQVQLIHTFRYCDYLGKYFCSACHKNQISTIPARVLDGWNFSLYPVSSFSYKWLDQIWNLPLFHVGDLNPRLYDKAKSLRKAREARLQLKYIQDFIEQCRFAEKEQGYLKEIPTHWTDDVDIWSMTDFVDTKNNVFTERILEIVARLEEHILSDKCELCTARGFFCELCPNKRDIIFPWQPKIKRCVHCGSCYHEKCFKDVCSKCERLSHRKRQLRSTRVTFS